MFSKSFITSGPDLSSEFEAVKHLYAVFLLTGKSVDGVMMLPIQSDCRDPFFFFLTSLTSSGSMLLLEYKLHYIPMVYCRAFQ